MSLFEVKNITVSFGGVKALNDVSFTVDKGEIFTIIGPNGAGKSTLFNVISRIYEPSNGEIFFDGKNISKIKPHNISSLGIARTFQNLELFENATVLQNMLLGRHIYKNTNILSEILFTNKTRQQEREHRLKIEEVIDFLDLQHYRDTLINGLPYGVRKNVELARALCTAPKLLLLDEPSSGLTNEETNDDAGDETDGMGVPSNNLPNAEELHNHINGMMEGKLGCLAKEISEETAKDLDINMEDATSVNDVVKQLFKTYSRECLCPPSTPFCICEHTAKIKIINKKVITPSNMEILSNKSSRSAKLRIIEALDNEEKHIEREAT